jgi:hypothetical protein
MPKYKEWVDSMFNRLRSHLDSEQQLETAREKHHLYKEDIDNHFKTLELRRKNRTKTDTTAAENQGTNKPATSDGNQPTK